MSECEYHGGKNPDCPICMTQLKDESQSSLAAPTGSEFVRVAVIAPFWRYAVGPTAGRSPAIPFYRLSAAMALFDEVKQLLPWAGVTLYKRRGLRGIEVVKEYSPNTGGKP